MGKLGLCTKTVYTTKEYDSFILHKNNRNIKGRGAKFEEMKESVRRVGLITPIVIDDGHVVVDGQHRLQICKDLGIPVEYIYRPGSLLALIALNNQRTNWQIDDYMKHFSGNPSYVKLKSMQEKAGLSPNATHALVKGKEIDAKEFKSGKFHISDLEMKEFNKNLHKLLDILDMEKGRHRSALSKTRAIATLGRLVSTKGYDHEWFKKKLSNVDRIVSVNTKDDAKRVLLEIYNKSRPKSKRINMVD